MNNEIKTISPFKNFCMTIGSLPTSYLESMSYYETLCWLIKYLENTINPAINNNAEALKELQEYVENLDLTDEVNTKLDEMAESGELAEIINVQMIGSLSNLITTNKNNLVSAINEVKTNINNIQLTDFQTYTSFTTMAGTGTATGIITVAKSNDGSVCKIYGALDWSDFQTDGTECTVRLNSDTGLHPESAIVINNCGFGIVGNYGILLDSNIRINSDGTIDFISSMYGDCIYKYIPFVIYVKDFGDVIQ